MNLMKMTKLFSLAMVFASAQSSMAATFTVQMTGGDRFSPTNITIAKGDTVVWTNIATVNHTSNSGDTNACSTNTFWNSGVVAPHTTYSLTFSNFSPGTYPYLCTIHCSFGMRGSLTITNPPIVPPSVSITNPVSGAKFLAPANITLMASAAGTDGSVTNVEFFSGASPLGNATTAPYNFTASNLAAGNYSFTAQALDNLGASATSAVVNVFVLTNAILSSPTRQADGQFQFTILGIAGQTYATEASTNLLNWSAIGTNVAPADSFSITDATSTNILLRFYRTRQDLF
jgi:plastocyanin